MLLVAEVVEKVRLDVSETDKNLFGIEKLNVKRSHIPAVTHLDYSARVQTVHKETNRLLHGLISKFRILTGVPLLINTSFNVRGEPIVCSPTDAFRCFMGTELDLLVCGNTMIAKRDQKKSIRENYKEKFEKD